MRLYDSKALGKYVADLIEVAPRGTQAKLARHMGVAVQTVNKWAQRSCAPVQENWPGIESYFGLEEGTLAGLGGVGEQKLSTLEAAIYDAAELDDDQRDAMLRVYRAFTA